MSSPPAEINCSTQPANQTKEDTCPRKRNPSNLPVSFALPAILKPEFKAQCSRSEISRPPTGIFLLKPINHLDGIF
jgi:hypothetical protein